MHKQGVTKMEVRLYETGYTHQYYLNGKLRENTENVSLVHIEGKGSFRCAPTMFGTQVDEFYEKDTLLKTLEECGNLRLVRTSNVSDDLADKVICAVLNHRKERTEKTKSDFHKKAIELFYVI